MPVANSMLYPFSILLAPLVLVACGGGGGGDGAAMTPVDEESDLPSGDDVEGGGSGTEGSGSDTAGESDPEDPTAFSGPNFRFRIEPEVTASTTDRWQDYFTRQMEAALAPLNELVGLVDETIGVSYARCGEANAFYDASTREVTICDEIVDDQLAYWSSTPAAIDSTVFILYHEIGHALDDVRDIPISGNTESAADSIAVVLATETDRGLAAVYGGDFLSSGPSSYGDEHTNGDDRAGDIVCWAIGGTTRFAFNSALASFTNQYIEANRDCIDEYAGQRDSIFASVAEIAAIVPPALTTPDEITPDDPDPPKNVESGESDSSLLDTLQNETDATVGRDIWICEASERSFEVGYLFVGDRGRYFQLTGEGDPDFLDFSITGSTASEIRLDYPDIEATETISNIELRGSTGFTGRSDTEGALGCTRVTLADDDTPAEETEPPPSGGVDGLALLYGTVYFEFTSFGGDTPLSATVTFDASGRRILDSGVEILLAEDAGPHETFDCRPSATGVGYFCVGIFESGAIGAFEFTLESTGNGEGRFIFCSSELSVDDCNARIAANEEVGPLTVRVTSRDGIRPGRGSYPSATGSESAGYSELAGMSAAD